MWGQFILMIMVLYTVVYLWPFSEGTSELLTMPPPHPPATPVLLSLVNLQIYF